MIAIFVKNGDRIKSGQIVAKIDSSGLDLDRDSALANWDSQKSRLQTLQNAPLPENLTQAEANLLQARLDLEQQTLLRDRNKTLAEKGLITQQQWEDYQRQVSEYQSKLTAMQSVYNAVKAGTLPEDLQAQRSAVSQAHSSFLKNQLILDSTIVKSPVSGTVTEILVNVGDLVSQTTSIMTVSDVDPMILRGYADEIDVTKIMVGQNATITLDAFPSEKLQGKVTEVDYRSTVQSNVTNFTVLVSIPNPKSQLMWGMSATAEVSTTNLRDVLLVPVSAVRTSTTGSQVTIQEGTNTFLWDILTGVSDGTNIQVIAGLDEGEEILAKATSAPRTETALPVRGANQFMRGFP